jgi:hypothetical protein
MKRLLPFILLGSALLFTAGCDELEEISIDLGGLPAYAFGGYYPDAGYYEESYYVEESYGYNDDYYYVEDPWYWEDWDW